MNSEILKKPLYLILSILLITASCSKRNGEPGSDGSDLTIFCINDQHGELENFSRIAHIVKLEEKLTNVIVVCGGDIFSGNPVVDNHPEKGYPMIDLMNRIGVDVAVLGNHEFDYGQIALGERMVQAEFDWVCANVDMGSSGIPQPLEYTTISLDGLKVTFLGLIETSGKENAAIPTTHPWRVENITFQRPEKVVSKYSGLKSQENSDLLIALTHLGFDGYGGNLGDRQLATQYPFFDLIIGGHSHDRAEEMINNIPVFQAGSHLNYLGKIALKVRDKEACSVEFELIDLKSYDAYDEDIESVVDGYNDLPYLNEVIGYSHAYHEKNQVGCFYVDALKGIMKTDVTFQNTGGIRSVLDEGDITNREIFEIVPFNNGTVIYSMSVSQITDFLTGSGSGFYYSGIHIEQVGQDVRISDDRNNLLSDQTMLTVGVNDYIPAVHDAYFPFDGNIQSLTAAETLISYLKLIDNQVNYTDCHRYFRYQY